MFFVALLGGVGWWMHQFLEPLPRWQVKGRYDIQGFVPGTNEVVTCTPIPNVEEDKPFLYEFTWWDLATGSQTRHVETFCSFHAFSNDFRAMVAGTGEELWIVHTETGRRVDVQAKWRFVRRSADYFSFSGSGRLLSGMSHEPFRVMVSDTETGIVRKRQHTANYHAHFLPDSERLVYRIESKDDLDRTQFWDGDLDRIVYSLGPHLCSYGNSPSGRFHFGLGKDALGQARLIEVFDLTNGRKLQEFSSPFDGDLGYWLYIDNFAKDENRFAIRSFDRDLPKWEIAFWDLAARKELSRIEPSPNSNLGVMSPDGRLFAFYHAEHVVAHPTIQSPPFHLQVFDVATGRELWRFSTKCGLGWPVTFTSDSRRLFLNHADTLQFHDAASGQLLTSFPCFRTAAPLISSRGGWRERSPIIADRYLLDEQSATGRTLQIPWIGTTFDLRDTSQVVVVDIERQRALARLQFDERQSARVADSGPVLVTCHRIGDDWYLAAWDLPPPKPWIKIVGIPLGLGLALVALKRLYHRLRKPAKTHTANAATGVR